MTQLHVCIREDLVSKPEDASSFTPFTGVELRHFETVSGEFISELISKSPDKSSSLDPMSDEAVPAGTYSQHHQNCECFSAQWPCT